MLNRIVVPLFAASLIATAGCGGNNCEEACEDIVDCRVPGVTIECDADACDDSDSLQEVADCVVDADSCEEKLACFE